jgi:hypothetical protein
LQHSGKILQWFSCNIIAWVAYVYNFIYGELCHYNICNLFDNTQVVKICW